MKNNEMAATKNAEITNAMMKKRIANGIKEFNNDIPDDEYLELHVGERAVLFIEKEGEVIHIRLYYLFSNKFVIEFFVKVGSDDAEIENIASGITHVVQNNYLCTIGQVQGIEGFI